MGLLTLRCFLGVKVGTYDTTRLPGRPPKIGVCADRINCPISQNHNQINRIYDWVVLIYVADKG